MTAALAAKTSGALHALQTLPPAGRAHPRQLGVDTVSSLPKVSARDLAASVPQRNSHKRLEGKSRVFFLDVNPLCYRGAQPSLLSFADWLSLFFSQVSLRDPVIAVLDGNDCNKFRRQLLPSYKANRRKFIGHWQELQGRSSASVSSSELQITNVLQKCNVPVGEKFCKKS